MQTLSPHNKGLVKRAISQSGDALSPWAVNEDPLTMAERVWLHCNLLTYLLGFSFLEQWQLWFQAFPMEISSVSKNDLSVCWFRLWQLIQRFPKTGLIRIFCHLAFVQVALKAGCPVGERMVECLRSLDARNLTMSTPYIPDGTPDCETCFFLGGANQWNHPANR